MEKLLFLDFDGVISNLGADHHLPGKTFSPHAMSKLKKIIDMTGTKVILSSVWKHTLLYPDRHETKDFLLSGLDFAGITPSYNPDLYDVYPELHNIYLKEDGKISKHKIKQGKKYNKRAQEILDFIGFYTHLKKDHLESWCVLDDEHEYYTSHGEILPEFRENLVLTTDFLEITEKTKHQAIEILGRK